MNKRMWYGSAAAVMIISQFSGITVYANTTTTDLRTKVVTLAGITTDTDTSAFITRGEFAKMCVQASSYKDTVNDATAVSAAADVPKDHAYAPYIRIALKQEWMRTYLGGNFKPDEYITMQDAAKAVLALLGYTNEDFSGDQNGARMAQFQALELNTNLNKEAGEILNKADCINLFYNLLKTNSKGSNTIYGALFDLELTGDQELNPNNMINTSLTGPILVKNGRNVADYVPFSTTDANIFLNGSASSMSTLKTALSSDGYLILYYNAATKTIWTYSESDMGSNASVYTVRGTVDNIYYSASDIMTPTSVVIDGQEYSLSGSEVQFTFSINGTITVGDEAVVVIEAANTSDGMSSGSITGAYKY